MSKHSTIEDEINALQARLRALQEQRKGELLKRRAALQREIEEIERQLGAENRSARRIRRRPLQVPPDAQIKQAVYKFLASHKEGVRGIRALTKGADITNVKAVTNWIKKNPKLLKTTGVKPHVRYFVP